MLMIFFHNNETDEKYINQLNHFLEMFFHEMRTLALSE